MTDCASLLSSPLSSCHDAGWDCENLLNPFQSNFDSFSISIENGVNGLQYHAFITFFITSNWASNKFYRCMGKRGVDFLSRHWWRIIKFVDGWAGAVGLKSNLARFERQQSWIWSDFPTFLEPPPASLSSEGCRTQPGGL